MTLRASRRRNSASLTSPMIGETFLLIRRSISALLRRAAFSGSARYAATRAATVIPELACPASTRRGSWPPSTYPRASSALPRAAARLVAG